MARRKQGKANPRGKAYGFRGLKPARNTRSGAGSTASAASTPSAQSAPSAASGS